MNKTDATAKAHALANDFMRPYAVVKMYYGYDAEPHNMLISPAELVEIVQPAALAPESNTEAAQQCADELEQGDFFAARVDDLPLLSGTAPRATVTPFVETEPQPTTPRLF